MVSDTTGVVSTRAQKVNSCAGCILLEHHLIICGQATCEDCEAAYSLQFLHLTDFT
jgi:hypothetical protein